MRNILLTKEREMDTTELAENSVTKYLKILRTVLDAKTKEEAALQFENYWKNREMIQCIIQDWEFDIKRLIHRVRYLKGQNALLNMTQESLREQVHEMFQGLVEARGYLEEEPRKPEDKPKDLED